MKHEVSKIYQYFFVYLQKEISSLQERLCGGGWEVERARLTAKLEQRERELRSTKDAHDVLSHHNDATKKEVRINRCNTIKYCFL